MLALLSLINHLNSFVPFITLRGAGIRAAAGQGFPAALPAAAPSSTQQSKDFTSASKYNDNEKPSAGHILLAFSSALRNKFCLFWPQKKC